MQIKCNYIIYFCCCCEEGVIFVEGILDQGSGVLIVYDEGPPDTTYTVALDTITHMGQVVDALYEKAKTLP